MQTTLTQAEAARSVRRLKFPSQIESDFQQHYYSLILTALRVGLFLMVGLAAGFLFASLSGKVLTEKVLLSGSVGLINLLLLVLSFRREFVAYWQHLVVGTICISTCLVSIEHSDYATM